MTLLRQVVHREMVARLSRGDLDERGLDWCDRHCLDRC